MYTMTPIELTTPDCRRRRDKWQTCQLPSKAGSDQSWLCWSSWNRLHTGIGQTTTKRWGYIGNKQSVNCYCCDPRTYLLCWRLLDECCVQRTSSQSQSGQKCHTVWARKWHYVACRTREEKLTADEFNVHSVSIRPTGMLHAAP